MRRVTEADFWARVDRSDLDGCWPWTRGRLAFGHGRTASLDAPGLRELTHRIAWKLVNGPIPAGLCVLHRCDNPPCCNPAHLFLGTKLDNARDAGAKGRMGRHIAARTHCKLGHPLDYVAPNNGKRGCNTCRRRQAAESRARHTRVSMTSHYARSEEPMRREALERLGRAVSA